MEEHVYVEPGGHQLGLDPELWPCDVCGVIRRFHATTTVTVETVAQERMVVSSPLDLDVTWIYKIRYTAIHTKEVNGPVLETRWRQEYGGLHNKWREYEGFDVLDMSFDGVIVLNGRDWYNLKRGITEYETELLRGRESVVRLRDTLDDWLRDH